MCVEKAVRKGYQSSSYASKARKQCTAEDILTRCESVRMIVVGIADEPQNKDI